MAFEVFALGTHEYGRLTKGKPVREIGIKFGLGGHRSAAEAGHVVIAHSG
jgi:hypothetical protein